MPEGNKPEFDYDGIAKALNRQRLVVPPNQREYSWEEEHVKDLFHDLAEAIGSNKPTYFLGTIVFTGGKEVPEVADGQQRLATTTILLAAIRDYYLARSESILVTAIENDFLFNIDRDSKSIVPRLTLNHEDRDYFRKRILAQPKEREKLDPPHIRSNQLIDQAGSIAAKHVANLVSQHNPKAALGTLEQWTKYLEHQATVITILVPDHLNAFQMFETLNDRGLKVSQTYLVKNFLFGEAREKMPEVQIRWGQMTKSLAQLEDDDSVMDYLRTLLIFLHGHTRKADVFRRVNDVVTGPHNAVQFANTLSEQSDNFLALISPSSAKWNPYPPSIRKYIEAINNLGVVVQRPVMLAVTARFSPKEAALAFRIILSWSVRFLIHGGGRSGSVEVAYAKMATEINGGNISTAKQLAVAASSQVPSDPEFETSFRYAKSKGALARYYLRALELAHLDDAEPQFLVNTDATQVTLEHVMPQNPEGWWNSIDPQLAESLHDRLGNLAILQASKNSLIGNSPFPEKAKVYAATSFEWTRMITTNYKTWNTVEIDDRQKRMAKLAPTIWPLKP